MIQPPADITIGQASVMHYTWGAIISDKTEQVWKFDKREYVGTWNSLVRITPLPRGMPTRSFSCRIRNAFKNLSTKS